MPSYTLNDTSIPHILRERLSAIIATSPCCEKNSGGGRWDLRGRNDYWQRREHPRLSVCMGVRGCGKPLHFFGQTSATRCAMYVYNSTLNFLTPRRSPTCCTLLQSLLPPCLQKIRFAFGGAASFDELVAFLKDGQLVLDAVDCRLIKQRVRWVTGSPPANAASR